MKKKGFTLAELMVSMGIVGLIAAITLPTLMQNSQKAQIGPKLTKAVAMFEQANSSLLNAKGVDFLSDLPAFTNNSGLKNRNIAYGEELSNYMKITETDDHASGITTGGCNLTSTLTSTTVSYLSKDGCAYLLRLNQTPQSTTVAPHKQFMGYVFIDINGKGKPNTPANDLFAFAAFNDGSLRPAGGTNWSENMNTTCSWTKDCKVNELPSQSYACTGHIFENNFKVLYK